MKLKEVKEDLVLLAMHEIDICIMDMSKNKVTLDDFLKLLDTCKKHQDKIEYYLTDDCRVFFPEGACGDLEVIKFIQGLSKKADNVFVTPAVCFRSGENYIAIMTEGDDFIMDQFTSITSALLALGNKYSETRIIDAEFNENNSKYLIKFGGDPRN